MTLGMSFVVLGLANVWQLQMVQTGSGVPAEFRSIGSTLLGGVIPYSLVVFVPIAALILFGLRRTGYGRMLYAVGDNPIAARLSGARPWQVLIVLYVITAMLAAIAGFLYSGLTNTASVTLVDTQVLPSVAAAVIGGTSILGGRGGFGGTIVGALILTVAHARCSRRWVSPRRSARSCSAPSSCSSRRPTPASRRRADGVRAQRGGMAANVRSMSSSIRTVASVTTAR